MIKKALITVAGYATRMYPITKVIPKSILPIGQKSAIIYILQEIINADIYEIIIVLNNNQQIIKEHLNKENYKFGINKSTDELINLLNKINITYVIQEKPLGLANAILCAKEEINNEDFVLLLGDDIFIPQKEYGIKHLINEYNEANNYYIGVKKVKKKLTKKYGIIKHTKNKVINICEKPTTNPPSLYACCGRYLFKNNIFNYLEKYNYENEILLTDILSDISLKENIYIVNIKNKHYDIGSIEGYINILKKIKKE